MKLKKIINLLVISVLTTVLQTGCAATSSANRYDKTNRLPEKDTTKIIRYADITDRDTSGQDEYQEWDDEPEDITSADDSTIISNLLKKFTITNNNVSNLDPTKETPEEKVIMEVIRYISTPYRYGGTTMKGIDCSAFTQNVFSNVFSFSLPRSAREQYEVGEVIGEREELKFGDLVFFNTTRRSKPGHVGIYLGDNFFAHASRKKGVTVSSLDESYYDKRYMGARRLEGLPLN